MNVRNEAMPKMIAGLDRDEQEREVDITPEMIEAGVEAFRRFVPYHDSREAIVEAIGEAMLLASKHSI